MSKPLTVSPSHVLLLATILVLGTLGVLHTGWLQRLDLMVYDLLLNRQGQPPPDDIVIISIDEASLQQIGPWPWSRHIHARLIDRLNAAEPRAITLDIPLGEPDRSGPDADRALAEAMDRNGKVVLAIAPGKAAGADYRAEALPLPVFTETAAALGHIDVEIDPDGRCRRLYLHAGRGNPHWPTLALATHSIGEGRISHQRTPSDRIDRVGEWVRQHPILIPYIGRERHFRYLSYADVLNGRVDLEQLRDRYVLVGTTAAGLGRAISTPMAQTYNRMPGVELNANVLAGLLRQHVVSEVPTWLRNLLTVLLIGVPLIVLIAEGNRHVLLMLAGAELLTLLTTALLLYGPGLWFPPGAALLTLAFAYLLLNRLHMRRTVQEAARSTRHSWRVTKVDGLTGLPVRERLIETLHTALPEASREGKLLGLLVLNLKRFKTVNDRLGRATADQLLAQAAKRVRKVVRQDDLMVRLGNDEFAVMMAGLDNRRPQQELAKRIEAALKEPFDAGPDPVVLSAHLAASLFPADGRDPDTLLQNSIAAMHHTRERGLPKISFYADQRRARAGGRSELESALQGALERDEFQLHYQPQISARGDRVVGVEVLLRWSSPQHGTVPPAEFIPIAERTGQIIPIGAWLLERACRQVQNWLDMGLPGLRMAINLSTAQLTHPGLTDTVREVLDRTGVDAKRLELEVTADSLTENPDATLKILSTLKKLGVRISLDNFGAGYSSLHTLKPFPLDRIKIDRSFIREIEPGNATANITRTMISMAHELKLEVVAEGVETEPQQTLLMDYECDELQGNLFGEPLSADAVEAVLRRTIHLVPRSEPAPLPA